MFGGRKPPAPVYREKCTGFLALSSREENSYVNLKGASILKSRIVERLFAIIS
jgi:hypothetical protein